MNSGPKRRILFEFIRVGAYVKVCAVDESTGTEVSLVGDPTRSPDYLKMLATRKLERVLQRQTQDQGRR